MEYLWIAVPTDKQWALLFIGIPWKSYSKYLEKISKKYLLPSLFLLYMTSWEMLCIELSWNFQEYHFLKHLWTSHFERKVNVQCNHWNISNIIIGICYSIFSYRNMYSFRKFHWFIFLKQKALLQKLVVLSIILTNFFH